jgi:hypothetical protein
LASPGQVRQIESSGRALSNALDIWLRGAITQHFSGQIQYTLSKLENNTGGITSFPANSFNPTGEWGLADLDQRHRLNVMGNLTAGKWLNFGLLFSAYSGKPYTVTTGSDNNNDGIANDRPAGVNRNTQIGPDYISLDVRWFHDFFLTKAKDKGPVLNASVDAFNATNRVNYVAYIGNLTSPFFGQPVTALPPRRLQLGIRLTF